MNVLVIDDEEILRSFYQDAMEAVGYQVTTASSGEEALQLLAQNPTGFDVVTTDFKMGGADGLDVLMNIQSHGYRVRPFLISGSLDPNLIETAKNFGAEKVFAKPISIKSLLAAIANHQPQPVPVPH